MIIYLTKQSENKIYNITQMAESVEWCGSVESVARTADVSIINGPYDCNINNLPKPAPGDYITLIENEEELFWGRVFGMEKTSETGTITINCIDNLQYLLKSKYRYNFKNSTAEGIALQVLTDIQFPVGELSATGVNIKSLLCDNDTVYDIIMQAYTQAHKVNQKLYMCVLRDRRLSVVEKGIMVTGFVLSEENNIIKSSYTESTENIVNQVNVYDEKGVQTGQITDQESVMKYGVFQELYTAEEGIPPSAAAESMLVKPQQSLSIEALGEIKCQSGYGVTIHDQTTGLKGIYWIKSDKHSFKDGIHTMELELDFKNLMDEKEGKEESK